MSIGMNSRTIKFVCLFLFSLVLGWDCLASASSNVERTKERFEAYIKALQQGSEEEAKKFWNKEEKESYKMYDWQWDWLTFWRVNTRHLNYRIISTKEKKGYVILEVEWYYREGKAGSLQKDVRYFIEEDGRMVGANPILIHTINWLQKKSRHFIYHYKSEKDEPTSAQLDKMDRFYEKMIDLLQVDYQDEGPGVVQREVPPPAHTRHDHRTADDTRAPVLVPRREDPVQPSDYSLHCHPIVRADERHFLAGLRAFEGAETQL